jgi:hypothetical protein
VDRAVDATAALELAVGRVHERVDLLLREIAAHALDPRHAAIVASPGSTERAWLR